MSGLKVLIVDDSHICADLMVLLLRQLGDQGRAAYDVDSGLKTAAEFQPQLIMLDLAMPERDGLSMICELREGTAFGNVPIVAFTGYADPAHQEQAMAAGFDAYLIKPCGIDQLRDFLVAFKVSLSESQRMRNLDLHPGQEPSNLHLMPGHPNRGHSPATTQLRSHCLD